MSTFDGKVVEFPDIRIDYFRSSDSQRRPPLAYFLSHVHSDHLVGLESCKSPFIYCSPATRDILLRLEKYPHRMNFAKGVLETQKQTYRHLKKLLKAIPLETSTVIELSPGKEIQVTLFDANHCVGAVMFLIEGDGKAILYTGDVRSELWWVNSLTRHPVLLPYLSFPYTRLDTIYLDTTFVTMGREDPYRHFPPKADGIKELLQKVDQYPRNTFFYFDAWTFGYEDVWQALSNFLGTRIHVDDYRYSLYRSLANGIDPKAPEAVKMMGFHCGNHFQEGCLTREQSRLHSCEQGAGCEIWNKDFVRITPIISRHNGVEMAELGAGGGQSDLHQQHELDVGDAGVVGQLMALCASKIQGQPQLLSSVLQMLTSVINDGVQSITLEDFELTADAGGALPNDNELPDVNELPLEKLVPALTTLVAKVKQKKVQTSSLSNVQPPADPSRRADGLPKQITFPYSRHASYEELCYLIEAFKPKNIHPCTVDKANWTPTGSMSFLFDHIYSKPSSFRHDQMMLKDRGVAADEGQVGNSQPASPESSSSDYATPIVGNSGPKNDQTKQASAKVWRQISTINKTTGRSLEASRPLSNKRRRSETHGQGDYWPPIDVDHYSPPIGRSIITDPTALQLEYDEDPSAQNWPKLNPIETASKTRLAARWHTRIDQAAVPEWKDVEERGMKKRDRNRHSLDYGRLSPPPVSVRGESDDLESEGHFDTLHRRQPPKEVRGSSAPMVFYSPNVSTPADTKVALRREVYNAVLDDDGQRWSDIGLVSVSGHRVKEEEL